MCLHDVSEFLTDVNFYDVTPYKRPVFTLRIYSSVEAGHQHQHPNKAAGKIIFFIYCSLRIIKRVETGSEKTKYARLLLLLLLLTAIGFSPGGSSLTPVQTPQYNNTYINGTAQIALHVLAIHPHNTMCLY
jgi:hypothetical protein